MLTFFQIIFVLNRVSDHSFSHTLCRNNTDADTPAARHSYLRETLPLMSCLEIKLTDSGVRYRREMSPPNLPLPSSTPSYSTGIVLWLLYSYRNRSRIALSRQLRWTGRWARGMLRSPFPSVYGRPREDFACQHWHWGCLGSSLRALL